MRNLKKISRNELKSISGGKKLPTDPTQKCGPIYCYDTATCCMQNDYYYCQNEGGSCK
ncbi:MULTISPECIES: bacteriocin-like protein [unclassified Chryseobacterium]|uniref:bacteriocin-like protein n=1 Tax=Chryseobacterium TaxID=59732 RepID=UPI0038D49608